VLDVEGVAGPRSALSRFLHLGGYPRVLISQDRSGALRIRLRVRGWFGDDIRTMEERVRDATRHAIAGFTNRNIAHIDVHFARLAPRRTLLDDARQGRIS